MTSGLEHQPAEADKDGPWVNGIDGFRHGRGGPGRIVEVAGEGIASAQTEGQENFQIVFDLGIDFTAYDIAASGKRKGTQSSRGSDAGR